MLFPINQISEHINSRKLLEDNREKRSILLESLVEVNEGNLCEVLKATIPYGLAYHHSGLTGDGNRLSYPR